MENNDSIHENDVEEDNTLMYIYEWVDSVPLSRQKKNIARDFNDGVLLAEMIKYHYPKLVDLHNYPSSSSTEMKMSNWNTLNHKVLKKLGLKITKDEINNVVNSKAGAIELLLSKVYKAIHGLPQEAKEENKEIVHEGEVKDIEEAKIQELIIEKDQEIMNLKDKIELLEKEINEANENQAMLENRVQQLNDLIRKNSIDIDS